MAHNIPSGTSLGGTITTANTSQVVAAANTYRKGLRFQNTSDTDMWINQSGGVAAVGNGCFKIKPDVILDIESPQRISVLCTVIGKTFSAADI